MFGLIEPPVPVPPPYKGGNGVGPEPELPSPVVVVVVVLLIYFWQPVISKRKHNKNKTLKSLLTFFVTILLVVPGRIVADIIKPPHKYFLVFFLTPQPERIKMNKYFHKIVVRHIRCLIVCLDAAAGYFHYKNTLPVIPPLIPKIIFSTAFYNFRNIFL